MKRAISCPSCTNPITVEQLFWTVTLIRFQCPNCAARVQPANLAFAISWLVVAAVVGVFVGLVLALIPGLVLGAAGRGLAYIGLIVLTLGVLAFVKWQASMALIKKGELKSLAP